MKYREALTSHWTLQECLSKSVNDALCQHGHFPLTLTTTQINIASLEPKPDETRPRSLFVEGNFRCKVLQKDILIHALQHAHDSRKISSRFAKEAFIKKSKVGLKQFSVKWTDAQIIDSSIVDSSYKNYEIYRSRSLKKDHKTNDIPIDDLDAIREQKKDQIPSIRNDHESDYESSKSMNKST